MLKYLNYYDTIHNSFVPKDASNLQKFGQVAAKYLLALVMCAFQFSKTGQIQGEINHGFWAEGVCTLAGVTKHAHK